MIDYLAPGYKSPSTVYFSGREVPKLYKDVKSKITLQLSSALSVGYTTDIWLSIVTKSYITLMAQFITSDFKQKSYILTTHMAERSSCATRMNLEKASGTSILVTTNSTSNMETAFSSSNWKIIHCVTHTLNLCLDEAFIIIEDCSTASVGTRSQCCFVLSPLG